MIRSTVLLAATGAPLRPRQRVAELEQLALRLLRELGVQILVTDELHNILAGRGESRREFLNLVRFLGNELRIPLAGVGTRDAYLAIRSDGQLENRFAPLTLPRWEGAQIVGPSTRPRQRFRPGGPIPLGDSQGDQCVSYSLGTLSPQLQPQ